MMKVQLENIGVLKYAEFELGDLTIICGRNNTGKTYATYSLYGFLDYWQHATIFPIADSDVKHLLSDGSVRMPMKPLVDQATKTIAKWCESYTKQLPYVFATDGKRFADSRFSIEIEKGALTPLSKYEKEFFSAKTHVFSIVKPEPADEIVVTLLADKARTPLPIEILRNEIGRAVREIVFGQTIPHAFIVSTERTGAAIFRGELNFARNRLIDELGTKETDVDPVKLLTKFDADYALPVRRNVDFTRHLETIAKSDSFLTKEYPGILDDFSSILGGKYEVTRNDELHFAPNGKKVKLSMDESSSSVRSLLALGFYLRHIANKGDLLMIDEPELNLHPENQRRVARLLARLVNAGIKVFITTHSDYLVKELNTLIMLSRQDGRLKNIAKREGYKTEELLSPSKIKTYIAKEDLVECPNNQRRTRCQTLIPVRLDESGMSVDSFDNTIEDLARIQDEIIWGSKE